jgi:rhodanese-related sulfurtransferase
MFGFGKKEPFGRLSMDEVERMVGQGAAEVFDNNAEERWKLGHVPTAHWLDPANVEQASLPADKERTVVFYCGGPL